MANDNVSVIAQALRSRGYCVLQDFFSGALLQGLLAEIQQADSHHFHQAGIGRDQAFQVNSRVRTDRIKWLDDQGVVPQAYLARMEALRFELNRELLLGLFDYECHYAHYPAGAFYKKHVDAFRGQSNRRLSTVLYLNPEWTVGDGGELVLYDENDIDVLETVLPTFGTIVLFLSEVFPHEVLPTRTSRYSLTGWFRVNETDGVILAPPR